MSWEAVEDVWRRERPHVLAALRHRHRDAERCEDAAQEALEAALRQWPVEGVPRSPRGWLLRVASRRYIDGQRKDEARRMREYLTAVHDRLDSPETSHDASDTTLEALLLCCHPALTSQTQVMLCLHAVLGLTTVQIADVFYLSEKTVGQRLSRAKAAIRRHRALPEPEDARDRLASVLRVLYVMFTQAHTLSRGDVLGDVHLAAEAIRLTRELLATLPRDPEVAGLLALMLLTEGRQPARQAGPGYVPLETQDRRLWDWHAIAEGIRLIEYVLPRGPVGPYQVQAAIAAVHGEALTWESTNWPQILALYRILEQVSPSMTVRLNRAVAEGMVLGPRHALQGLDEEFSDDDRARAGHRYFAVRAHMLEQAGDVHDAAVAYARAVDLCRSSPERTHLSRCLDRVR